MEDTRGIVRLGMPHDDKPQERELLRFLTKYCKLWRDIGLLLGLLPAVLDNIDKENYSQRECFRLTLDNWLQLNDNATWGELEFAITNANRLALDLKPLESLDIATTTEESLELVKQFKDVTLQKLMIKYARVTVRIRHFVKKMEINIQDAITALCYADIKKCTVFSTDHAFETIDTIDKLFHHIGRYCTIFDYNVLDMFLQVIECQDGIDELNKFTDLLQSGVLKEVDLLSESGKLWNPADQFIQGSYKFVVEYVGGTGLLEAQKMIQSIIQQRVNLKRGTLIFRGFGAGSVLFIYQVSEAVKLYLLHYKFTEQDLIMFAALFIRQLTVDNDIIMNSYEEDLLLQGVCLEEDLTRISERFTEWESVYRYLEVTESEAIAVRKYNYTQQKIAIFKIWKRRRGFQATFKALFDVFSKQLKDQTMAGIIYELATVAMTEPSEDVVIEHIKEFEQFSIDTLHVSVIGAHMITDAYSETIENAVNDKKRLEVIIATLLCANKRILTAFLMTLVSGVMRYADHQEEEELPISLLMDTKPNPDKQFRKAVQLIKSHLQKCDVQKLIMDFNITINDTPYISDKVKNQLLKCKTIKDLFVRLSPYISWCKYDVLQHLVEVSGCEDAVDELNKFETQLDTSQSIVLYPLSQPSSSICPDLEKDITMIAVKLNKDLRTVTYNDVKQFRTAFAQMGGTNRNALDLQSFVGGSSILYWLIPRNTVTSFEQNIRSNLDHLYNQGVKEILLDPNIVITTGRDVRIRSLSHLTSPTKHPEIIEELEQLHLAAEMHPEKAGDVTKMTQELHEDLSKMTKKNEKISSLVSDLQVKHDKAQQLEQDTMEKQHDCDDLRTELQKSMEERGELEQIYKVSAQLTKEETTMEQVTHHINSKRYVNLSFGVRGHTAVNCGGKIYIGGGVVSRNGGAADVIQVIDLSTQHVSQLPSCPVKHFGLVCIDNQVVTVGGKTKWDDQITGKLYCWKEATQQWEESLPAMPTPRHFLTSVVWNNYLIVCGGRIDNQDTITDCVEILNLQSKHWHTASSLPLQESGKHAVITDNGKLYLLGGYLGNAVHYCELHKLVASTIIAATQPQEAILVWRRLEDTPSTDCAAVLLRGSLVIIGGRNHDVNKISSTILRYSNVSDEWEHVGDLLYSRTACMAVALDYDTVLVTGGTVLHDQQPDWNSASTEIVVSR